MECADRPPEMSLTQLLPTSGDGEVRIMGQGRPRPVKTEWMRDLQEASHHFKIWLGLHYRVGWMQQRKRWSSSSGARSKAPVARLSCPSVTRSHAAEHGAEIARVKDATTLHIYLWPRKETLPAVHLRFTPSKWNFDTTVANFQSPHREKQKWEKMQWKHHQNQVSENKSFTGAEQMGLPSLKFLRESINEWENNAQGRRQTIVSWRQGML